MGESFEQFNSKRPFVDSSLIKLRAEQRKFLLLIPESLVIKARPVGDTLKESKIQAVFEGQLEMIVRKIVQKRIDEFDQLSIKWLNETRDSEIARKLREATFIYMQQAGSPDVLGQLGVKSQRDSEKIVDPLDARQRFNGDPDLVDLVALMDFADWLAGDGFSDPRTLDT